MSVLQWLEEWFAARGDGAWPRRFAITIGTLDNPGWSLAIALNDTELETRAFERLEIERTPTDWLYAWVERGTFHTACGARNLSDTMEIFRAWSEGRQSAPHPRESAQPCVLEWLQAWYATRCDGDWEHQHGVSIDSLSTPGWWLRIDLAGTAARAATQDRVHNARSATDWLRFWVEGARFEATCGSKNLGEAVETFRSWFEHQQLAQLARVAPDLAATAARILHGSLGLVDGLRSLATLDEDAGRLDHPALAKIRAWYPNVETVPAEAREHFAPEYLRRLEAGACAYADALRAEILLSCREIVSTYGAR